MLVKEAHFNLQNHFNKNTNLYNKEEIVVEIGLQLIFLTFRICALLLLIFILFFIFFGGFCLSFDGFFIPVYFFLDMIIMCLKQPKCLKLCLIWLSTLFQVKKKLKPFCGEGQCCTTAVISCKTKVQAQSGHPIRVVLNIFLCVGPADDPAPPGELIIYWSDGH